jgi:DNA-binding response OmpR family regulator
LDRLIRILIVEDEAGIVQFLQQGLEEEGYSVTTASDGEQGLQFLLNESFDLVLLDWMLPKMTGIEVCKSFRLHNTTTAVIFLTAKDTIQETIEGLQVGANDYIKKPFSFEELLERMKVHFRNLEKIQLLHLGPVEINVSQHQVLVNNIEVSLTNREFDLLYYLVKNKGRVCTRTQIIEDVWDIHFDYDTGVIDVFMNSIRKKINFKKEEDYIKTIRGVGYIAND